MFPPCGHFGLHHHSAHLACGIFMLLPLCFPKRTRALKVPNFQTVILSVEQPHTQLWMGNAKAYFALCLQSPAEKLCCFFFHIFLMFQRRHKQGCLRRWNHRLACSEDTKLGEISLPLMTSRRAVAGEEHAVLREGASKRRKGEARTRYAAIVQRRSS